MLGGASPGNSREKVLGNIGDGDPVHGELSAVLELPEAGREGLDLCIAVGGGVEGREKGRGETERERKGGSEGERGKEGEGERGKEE